MTLWKPAARVDNDPESLKSIWGRIEHDQTTNVQNGSPRKHGAATSSTKFKVEMTLVLWQFYFTITTFSRQDIVVQVDFREHTHLQNDNRSQPERSYSRQHQTWSVLEVKITEHVDRYGCEKKISFTPIRQSAGFLTRMWRSFLKRIRNLITMKKRHEAWRRSSR